jgi:hypothetical protein
VSAEENTLPKRKEVRGSRRELYNADILNFTLHQIFWVMKLRTVGWTGHVVMHGSVKSAYEILVRSPEKGMQLLTPMSKWRDAVTFHLKCLKYVAVWTLLALLRIKAIGGFLSFRL